MDVLHYLCSKNKGADQLGGYSAADLRLSFLFRQKVFSRFRSFVLPSQKLRKTFLMLSLTCILSTSYGAML